MAVRTRRPGTIGTIGLDLRRLHAGWMGLVFSRRHIAAGRVHGHRVPDTAGGRIAYDGWVGLGALVVALLYPLVLMGFGLRGPARRIDRAAAGLGALVVASAVVWGGLVAVVSPRAGLAAIAAPVLLVTPAAAVALSRTGGRVTTVLLAYPSGVTALVLPPVAVALSLATSLDATASVGVGVGITVLLGWVFGSGVALADLVRPSRQGRI